MMKQKKSGYMVLAGEDIYAVNGSANDTKMIIVGGTDKDSIIQHSGGRINVYDDRNNFFQTTNAKLHLSSDSAIHAFNYAGYNYDKKGVKSSVFYNNDDRLYVGLGYGFTKYKWRRNPFATKQFIGINYSISQKAISAIYTAEFPHRIGNWDLLLSGNYDAVRWTNFFGLGNETGFNYKR